ncbi:25S rRNA (adenine645-N1)-methyltransferase [Branchiostoma belcheri]|nr:25S rRNA (adenine645-N1)-methyltransferase [Branchiostoma belcheri]
MTMFGASDWGDDDEAARLAQSLFSSGDGLSSFTKHKRKSVKSKEVLQHGGNQETIEKKKEDHKVGSDQSNGSSAMPHKPKRKRTRKKRPHLQGDLSAEGTEMSTKPQLTLKQKRKLKRKRQEESEGGKDVFSSLQSKGDRETQPTTKKARKSKTQQKGGVDETDNCADAGPVRVKKPSFKQGTAKDSKIPPAGTSEVPKTSVKRKTTEMGSEPSVQSIKGKTSDVYEVPPVKMQKIQKSKHAEKETDLNKDTTGQNDQTGKAVLKEKVKMAKAGITEKAPQQVAKEEKVETSPSAKPPGRKKSSPFAKLQKVFQFMRPKQEAEKSPPSFPEPNILHLVNMSDEEDKESPEKDTKEEVLDRSSVLRQKMEARLKSARFRQINEMLYTTTGGEARRMFQKDPDAFQVYHQGFSAQVQKWPVNPVDKIIAWLKRRPSSEVVADFGCGDAKIARNVKNRVHSFDLVAVNKHVTVCDMTKVPLEDETVDVAVFCLALMGTNTSDFLREANRVLRLGGVLKIAEVASRFENVNGFLRGLGLFGFKLVSKDLSNSHFVMFEFTKMSEPKTSRASSALELRPCLYKKR